MSCSPVLLLCSAFGCWQNAQLVCFYYVLTTFTTVGYGKIRVRKVVCSVQSAAPQLSGTGMTWIASCVSAGDIYATTGGERVSETYCCQSIAERK